MFEQCDGKEPACSQCILRKIPCSGYQQEFVFVSQGASETEDKGGLKIRDKTPPGYRTKAHDGSDRDRGRYGGNSQLASLDRAFQLEIKCGCELEDDIQFILQHYAPVESNAPAESNPFHNQICGAWVEVLPLLSATRRNKPFLLSAIKTLAAALRHWNIGNELGEPQILEMYGASLARMGKALEEAQYGFQVEHSIAIMCLAVTDVSAKNGLT